MATPKKNNRRPMDITPADKTTPDISSRPLIVGNRSAVADPMVVPDHSSSEPTTSPVLGEHTRVIQPASSVEPDEDNAAIATPKAPTEPSAEITDTDAARVKPAVSPKPVKSAVPHADEDVPAPDDATPSPRPTDDKTPSLVSKLDDKPASADSATAQDEADAEKAAEAERAEHLEELVENKTYFLPINQNQTKTGWVLLLLLVLAVAGGIGYMTTMAHR